MNLEEIIKHLESGVYNQSISKYILTVDVVKMCKEAYLNGNRGYLYRLCNTYKGLGANYIDIQIFLYLNGDVTDLNKKQLKAICTYHLKRCENYKSYDGVKMWYNLRKQFSRGGENMPKSELSQKTIELVGFNSGRAKRWVKRIMLNPNDKKAAIKIAKHKR